MSWPRRLVTVVTATLVVLLLATAVGVVRDWYGGECWPWESRQDSAGATFCDGRPHPHSR